jgi:hypothetical protein
MTMPGVFYIEGKKEKEIIEKLVGLAPVSGSAAGDWQAAESDVVFIGSSGTKYKLHSLLLSIHNLVGTAITVRLYLPVNAGKRDRAQGLRAGV